MNRRSVFGSHLYNQIVIPLLVASVVVGLVATAVAVFFLRDLTDRWVTQVADAVTTGVIKNYDTYTDELVGVARAAATNSDVVKASNTGDAADLHAAMSALGKPVAYDDMIVLDASGTVVASASSAKFEPGARPFKLRGAQVEMPDLWSRTSLVTYNGTPALAAFEPMTAKNGRLYTLAAVTTIGDAFLRGMAGPEGAAFSLYGPDRERIAVAVLGGQSDAEQLALADALRNGSPGVRDAVAKATSTDAGISHLTVGQRHYEVLARRIASSGGPQGPSYGYVVGVVSQAVTDEAGRTTTNLIMIWSIVAVVALVGLGGWVARSVSEPLAELSDGARRIADGDFSTKVHVTGTNEIAVLAATFNDMTESLRERSGTLTKKVLELATLYEMSRALGATLDMDELLGSVLDSALRIFDLDLGYVALRDKETGDLAILAVRGVSESAPDVAVRSSMSEWVVREGRPLIFNPDPTSRGGQIDTVTGARAALCVPLVSSEGTIGSITVGSDDADYRFNSDDVRLLSTIANHVTIAIGNIELFSSLQDAYLATVRSLAAAVDAKDTYTRGHSDRVAGYATLIAERLGIAHEQRVALEMAAYLHDIGKIGIAEEILLKPGALTDDEMAQMRHHPLIGANILKPVAFPWAITPVVRHHHEYFDGTGYPAGLRGDEIPLLARILTAADSYEAMTADRPYRTGLSSTDAIAELRRCSGTQFDPRIVDALVSIVEELELTGEGVLPESVDEIAPEEARVIFAALVDGVFSSFRRLGGPRLANNVEVEVDKQFDAEGWPFSVKRGRLAFSGAMPSTLDEELMEMRAAMRRIDATLSRVSGSALVDHFYADAYAGFSARMRHLADALDLRIDA